MSYYAMGMAAPVKPNPTMSLVQDVRSHWTAVRKGVPSRALWKSGNAIEVSGVKSSIVTFIMDLAHIILLLSGLWLLITSVM